MGLFTDILETNRERECSNYVDPCSTLWSFQNAQYKFNKYRDKLKQYEVERLDDSQVIQMKEEFQKKSMELEKLKASYLIAEKSILEILNRGKLRSGYMKDMLDALQQQLQESYRAICKLRLEIDKKVGLELKCSIEPENEECIRMSLLERLIKANLLHMEKKIFNDTSTFRKVVSDCAEVIRCLKNEEYLQSDKMVFNYYLIENMGLKLGHHVCRNCGKPLLANVPYCLNCYERN